MEVFDFDILANNNNNTPPDGFPENMQYSEVNNAAREFMAAIARYLVLQQGQTTGGAGNAYELASSITSFFSAYPDGVTAIFEADKTNTGASTFKIGTGAAKALVHTGGAAVTSGEIVSGSRYLVQYVLADDHFRILNHT